MGSPSASTVSPQARFERRLIEALKRRALVDDTDLTDALEQQVIMGGHLATALWELGICKGDEVMALSAEILKLPPAPPRAVAKTPRRVLNLLDKRFVAKHRLIPLALRDHELKVAICDPWNLRALDEAAFHSGTRIKPYFLAEVPLVKLLEKLYGVPTTPRFKLAPQRRVRVQESGPVAHDTVGEDLIDQAEFEAIYGSGDAARTGEQAGTTAPQEPEELEEIEILDEEVAAGDAFDLADVSVAPVAEAEAPEAPIIELVEEVETPAAAAAALAPITAMAAANEALAAATDRDELGTVLVRFALSKGPRVALFSRAGELWMGWTGAGPGIDPERLRALMIPTEPGTCFGIVGQTGGHYLGPLRPHPVHDRFLKALGGQQPQSVGLFPVQWSGRIVFGIYLDGGDGAYVSPDIAEILVFAQRVPAALQRLMRQQQQGA